MDTMQSVVYTVLLYTAVIWCTFLGYIVGQYLPFAPEG